MPSLYHVRHVAFELVRSSEQPQDHVLPPHRLDETSLSRGNDATAVTHGFTQVSVVDRRQTSDRRRVIDDHDSGYAGRRMSAGRFRVALVRR